MMKTRFALVAVLLLALTLSGGTAVAGCFQVYHDQILECSWLPDLADEVACNLDAATELSGCVRRGIWG